MYRLSRLRDVVDTLLFIAAVVLICAAIPW